MTPHSLQLMRGSPHSAAVAVTATQGLVIKINAAAAPAPKTQAPRNQRKSPDVRAASIPRRLSEIEGYDHGGLNE